MHSSEPSVCDHQLILVVDDDREIRELMCSFLRRHGYEAIAVAEATEMDRVLGTRQVDLVVLDCMLPGEDGLSVCRRLSGSGGPPVVMLSALGGDTDRIVGLELGADDYLPKPCNPRELLARVRAVLRRRHSGHSGHAAAGEGRAARFSGWRLDLVKRELEAPGGDVFPLSTREFALLRVFAERPRRVLTRDQLLELTRGNGESFDRAIDVQISRLRKKLGSGGRDELIQTIRGEGYTFASDVSWS